MDEASATAIAKKCIKAAEVQVAEIESVRLQDAVPERDLPRAWVVVFALPRVEGEVSCPDCVVVVVEDATGKAEILAGM